MSRRTRTSGPSISIISWRDIPAQVVAEAGARRSKAELPRRFQLAIDRAAMNAGLQGTDEYLAEWHKDSRPCGDDLESEIASVVSRIEAEFPPAALDALADRGGFRH